ncbi:nuclease-related domain-containing protein [Raoultibacter phocaeensis]|uniref:nuclease-related domain-containing protein n=1 Tax=Raoultibacter phocaeensis TaxID=2479841 RepID=UPI002105B9C0|nr:nuclease-related domain-containing protein [Raoultibacter phocaeensis]
MENAKKCICWNCGEDVSLEYAGKTCPECGASLTVFDYDEVAKEVLELKEALKNETDVLRVRVEKAAGRNRCFGFLGRCRFFPTLVLLKKKVSALGRREKEIAETEKRLAELAAARWYCGLWFRETAMLPRSLGGNSSAIDSVFYNGEGKYEVESSASNLSREAGEYGEYRVFDLLSQSVEAGEFGYAHLIPRVFVPVLRNPYSRRCQNSYAEIDAVLITERVVVAIEVKNVSCEIDIRYVQGKGHRVEFRYHDDMGRVLRREKSNVIKQNAYHCKALEHALENCGVKKAVNLVVFCESDPRVNVSTQGRDGVFVATNWRGGRYLPKVIHRVIRKSARMRTREQVDALYEHIKLNYSDPHGSKAKSHVKEVREGKRLDEMIKAMRFFEAS